MKKITTGGQEDGPSFDLPLENELLILKLKAEFGAECTTGTENIPPAVVNEFLKSVYEFEQKFREPRPLKRIYEKIGLPYFRRAEEMGDKHLSRELKRMRQLLQEHRLELDVMGEYPERLIYKFITEEFFVHEMEDLDMPGYIHHFCYEDFHPNHDLEIRQRALEFITQWFSQQLNEYSWQLSDPFIHPDTREFQKEIILKKINNLFAAYSSFSNCEYLIRQVKFDWNEENECGRGYVEGSVKYDGRMENGELIHIEGPFEFYLSNSGSWWTIFYFVFPGFNWNG
jgi:hypothetical protein